MSRPRPRHLSTSWLRQHWDRVETATLLHLFRYCKHPWSWQINGQKAPSVSICVFGTENKWAFRVKIWIMGFVLVHMAAHCRTQCDFHVNAAFCPAYIHLVHLFVSFVAMPTSTTSIQRPVRSPWLWLGVKKNPYKRLEWFWVAKPVLYFKIRAVQTGVSLTLCLVPLVKALTVTFYRLLLLHYLLPPHHHRLKFQF